MPLELKTLMQHLKQTLLHLKEIYFKQAIQFKKKYHFQPNNKICVSLRIALAIAILCF